MYALSHKSTQKKKGWKSLLYLWPLVKQARKHILLAMVGIILNATAMLSAPLLIARVIDHAINNQDVQELWIITGILLGVFILGFIGNALQTFQMGMIGREVLFQLRENIFAQIQSLPIAFFQQNKVGDLISRINNDTDKLNDFFSRGLVQFVSNVVMMAGASIFLIALDAPLGVTSLLPAGAMFLFAQFVGSWMARMNKMSLQTLGVFSGAIQESVSHMKAIISFHRQDYMEKRLVEANEANAQSAIRAGIANNIFTPFYTLSTGIAQLIVLLFGIVRVAQGDITTGLLVSFFLYVNNVYMPIRQLASTWATFQQAIAALERISEVMELSSDLKRQESSYEQTTDPVLAFQDVSFGYTEEHMVLNHINLTLKEGKTYAFVGPTGGGKTTIASLMARLYDPSKGTVLFHGVDIRSLSDEERTQAIGFILQEPFLFGGTLLENVFYGHDDAKQFTKEEQLAEIHASGLDGCLAQFPEGMETVLHALDERLSLGQKQIIAFMRAVLRKPALLILDEATANIDTVTEQTLDVVLRALPKTTTKVVIAHRLNTIQDADEIYFVNDGTVVSAGSFDHAVELLKHGNKTS